MNHTFPYKSTAVFIIICFVNAVNSYQVHYLDEFNASSSSVVSLGERANSSVVLKAFKPETYRLNRSRDFEVTISAPDSKGIIVSVYYIFFPDSCEKQDVIKLRSADKNVTICDVYYKNNREAIKAEIFFAPNVTLSYAIRGKTNLSFDFTVTAFQVKKCHLKSKEKYFNCNNGLCIWFGLICDDRNNCGNDFDEDLARICPNSKSTDRSYLVGKFIFVLVAFFMISFIICFFLRRCLVKKRLYNRADLIHIQTGDDPNLPEHMRLHPNAQRRPSQAGSPARRSSQPGPEITNNEEAPKKHKSTTRTDLNSN